MKLKESIKDIEETLKQLLEGQKNKALTAKQESLKAVSRKTILNCRKKESSLKKV